MLKYLVILLDDTAVSFCHYTVTKQEPRLIDLDVLKRGIFFAMKENLSIQFIYPNYTLPEEYKAVINTIDHTDIKSAEVNTRADVVIIGTKEVKDGFISLSDGTYVWRGTKEELFAQLDHLIQLSGEVKRLNIVITDIERFTTEDFDHYREALEKWSDHLAKLYGEGHTPQLNLLTDRLLLDQMNNCNAGVESLTLAPDGSFYVCPAFYYATDGYAVGSLEKGLDIKNPQLYRLDHAPLCRNCDAYQCRRCIWLNRKTTLEVNTPSHEQCVVAHLERNASRELLNKIRQHGEFLPEKEIKEIDYLDPFDVRKEW